MSTHSGDKGTGTFIRQRVTALINIPLILFAVWLVASLAGADRAQMASTFTNPFIAIVTLVLLGSVLVHMRIGMQEVIDDYIHDPRIHRLCMFLNTFFAVAVGVIAAISILVLAFGG
jgi:succinate dehydrogenase / fumarate reductase, membrane anchor subunit